ncbi:unnamed protein product [Ranitomeya imitator]|uniref:Uncharacterized protein n=1 Tax=Ranitomeya imitator TaxID=111125 RepID=A0ABN9MAV6_9NEOB|nr:unnamed protein product [Ranitomeya imitator]
MLRALLNVGALEQTAELSSLKTQKSIYSLAIGEYLGESYRKKLETLGEVLDKSSQKPKTIDDSIKDKYEAAITVSDNGDDNSTRSDNGTDALKETLGIDLSNQFAGYIPLDCLLCKISHC